MQKLRITVLVTQETRDALYLQAQEERRPMASLISIILDDYVAERKGGPQGDPEEE